MPLWFRTIVLLLALGACRAPSQPSFESQRAADHNRHARQAIDRGDLDVARRHVELALARATERDDRRREAEARSLLARLVELSGDAEPAEDHYSAALRLAQGETSGAATYDDGVLEAALGRARVRAARGDPGGAVDDLDLADRAAERLGSRSALAAVRLGRATVLHQQGDRLGAFKAAREASRLFEIAGDADGDLRGRAAARILLGRLMREEGDPVASIQELRVAARSAAKVRDPDLEGRALEEIGGVLEELGHLQDARLHYRRAVELLRRSPRADAPRSALASLARVSERIEPPGLTEEDAAPFGEMDEGLDDDAAPGDEIRSEVQDGGGR